MSCSGVRGAAALGGELVPAIEAIVQVGHKLKGAPDAVVANG